MKTLIACCLLSCVALVAVPTVANAADASKTETATTMLKKVVMPGHEHALRGVFGKADADHDGVVTKAEWLASETAYFDSIDTNHDGKLSGDEIKAQRDAMMKKRMMWHAEHQAETMHKGGAVPVPATANKK